MAKLATVTFTLRSAGTGQSHDMVGMDYTRDDVRHRVTLSDAMAPEAVLHPVLAAVVHEVLGKLSGPRAVLSEPDRVVALPGLTLGRMQVMSTEREAGVTQVLVRFTHAIGGLHAALSRDVGLDGASALDHRALETVLLQDIAMPVLDALHVIDMPDLPEAAHERLNARLNRLAQCRDELLFHFDLLKRHVQNGDLREAPLLVRDGTDLPLVAAR